jgi:rhamnogalacturonyl hydrolase YesR
MASLPRLFLALCAAALTLRAESVSQDLSGRSDESIRNVVTLVARHQQQQFGPIRDGEYPRVTSLEAAKAARPPEGISWSYPWGVTLYGVIRSTDLTGDRALLAWALEHNRVVTRAFEWLTSVHAAVGDSPEWNAFIRDNKRVKIGGLLRLGNLDSCGAMGTQFLEGLKRSGTTPTPAEEAVIDRVASWVVDRQERLPDGTFWRPNAKDQNGAWPNGTIWADDLYMGGVFLVRLAEHRHDGKYLTEAARHVLNMAARLQDKDGLWFHAYSVPRQEHSPYKWGRANGWIMVSTAEILSAMPPDHPDRAALLDVFRRHVAGVKQVQPASGVWHQILDDPSLWEETSCTAMFAYAIARGVNRGWLPASDLAVARNAFAGICAHYLTPAGEILGTSEGTNIGMKREYYADRKRPVDDLHGRGVLLLAGTEILNPK